MNKNAHLAAAIAMVVVSAALQQPEFAIPAVLFGGAYVMKRRAEKMNQLEKRVDLALGELESANTELEQLRKEREFDRKLLHEKK